MTLLFLRVLAVRQRLTLKDDIVNMGMAKLVDAPVLLVGDIDRGGVFAQLVGTIMLLEEEERRRVKGLVMNKFRGDKRILEPGIKQLYDICPIPVAGVIPYVKLDIDDEDSLASRIEPSVYNAHMSDEQFDIVVIRVPHISNFTILMHLSVLKRLICVMQTRQNRLEIPTS